MSSGPSRRRSSSAPRPTPAPSPRRSSGPWPRARIDRSSCRSPTRPRTPRRPRPTSWPGRTDGHSSRPARHSRRSPSMATPRDRPGQQRLHLPGLGLARSRPRRAGQRRDAPAAAQTLAEHNRRSGRDRGALPERRDLRGLARDRDRGRARRSAARRLPDDTDVAAPVDASMWWPATPHRLAGAPARPVGASSEG
jgi:hypothetical protein